MRAERYPLVFAVSTAVLLLAVVFSTGGDYEYFQGSPPRRHTANVGIYIDADGLPRRYPGNAVTVAVPTASKQGAAVAAAHSLYSNMASASKFALRPAPADGSSVTWRAVVADLVADQVRVASHWTPVLSSTASIEEADAELRPRVEGVPFAAGSVRLRVSVNATLDAWEEDGDLVVGLEPADASSRAALAAYRGAVARATGVKHPGHDRFLPRIVLAYGCRTLSDYERREVGIVIAVAIDSLQRDFGLWTLPPPAFTYSADVWTWSEDRRPTPAGAIGTGNKNE